MATRLDKIAAKNGFGDEATFREISKHLRLYEAGAEAFARLPGAKTSMGRYGPVINRSINSRYAKEFGRVFMHKGRVLTFEEAEKRRPKRLAAFKEKLKKIGYDMNNLPDPEIYPINLLEEL